MKQAISEFRLTEITPILQKCLDDPKFLAKLSTALCAAHPEFASMRSKLQDFEFVFSARKCITTTMLCASGALNACSMSEKMDLCETQIWTRHELFPIWIDCLIDTVHAFHRLSPELRSGWRKALQGCMSR